MTKDKKRKQSIRAAQQASSRRYTQAAREVGDWSARRKTFQLAELLTECSSSPQIPFDSAGPQDHWAAPQRFASDVLGTAVPFGSVLELAGALAQAGRAAALELESLTPGSRAVLLHGQRRFEMTLSQELVVELCRWRDCPNSLWDAPISWCDAHLRQCDAATLVHQAQLWGCARFHWADYAPELCGGGRGADRLVRAAVVQDASKEVVHTLLDTCFDDPDLVADSTLNDAVPMRLRHAIDRERLRLEGAARSEASRLRKSTGLTRLPH
ncbi:hypothetical protein ACWCYK_31520 [Streptomyces lydicamycinicus]